MVGHTSALWKLEFLERKLEYDRKSFGQNGCPGYLIHHVAQKACFQEEQMDSPVFDLSYLTDLLPFGLLHCYEA
ncbi:hypothetical protein M514_04231 [Trichuris suis]|uniref:Uncharacterized protein n=1 Tax=Trichuris suis TaxID=68888 RepID=A0A085MC51_9BILA|nr:hypothetical protein M513_04231 [Trichuris suis]KFD71673.1 hypothetical protein M514_04231 [Trichuris suis]